MFFSLPPEGDTSSWGLPWGRVTFFRANRQYLIHIDAVESFHSDPDGKITAFLQHSERAEISISRERGSAFKKWLLG